jgi:formamidopyrimidine-DNA glycosylase
VPELPDVEAHRRPVAQHAHGKVVRWVAVHDPELLDGTSAPGLGRSLLGRAIGSPRRRGKWLLVPTEEDDALDRDQLRAILWTGERG